MSIQVCPVCGIQKIDGTFRFSYKPTVVVSPDDVAGLICFNVSLGAKADMINYCINKDGAITPDSNSWEKRRKFID
jgi:hypothetical protein